MRGKERAGAGELGSSRGTRALDVQGGWTSSFERKKLILEGLREIKSL